MPELATLWVMHHATCARKALFVVLEKGLLEGEPALRTHEVAREYLRTPAYRALNPDGVVPTLVLPGGDVLVESSIIMRYLDDAFPGPTLQPSDPLERARQNLWMKRVDEKWFPALQAITIAVFMRKMFGAPPDEARLAVMLDALTDHGLRLMREDAIRRGPESAWVTSGLRSVRGMLDELEDALAQHPYLAGDLISLADCAVTPLVLRLEELGLADAWRTARPRLTAWWARISARPSVQQLVAMANQALLTELTSSIGDARATYVAALSG